MMEERVTSPDNVKEQIELLRRLKHKTQALVDCKASLLQKTESLDLKKNLLEEIVSERHRLQKEKKMLLDVLQAVQRDIESVFEIEKSLACERDDLEKSVMSIRAQEYEPLHELVNDIRQKQGMPKLPHVQQELEAQLARVLEERREKWQQNGDEGLSSASPPWSPAGSPETASSSRRRAASTSSRRTKRRRQ